jgi:hypothetical protein
MNATEKTKLLLEAKKLPFTREGIEALLLRCQTRGNLPEATDYVSKCLLEFNKDKSAPLIEAAKELFPKKVAKKRTRGPNKKK